MSDQAQAPKYFGTLKIKDRLDYPQLLYKIIIASAETVRDIDKSERAVQEAIRLIVRMVPDQWKDQEFKDAYKKAKIIKNVDIRPLFCGKPASLVYCLKHGIRTHRKELSFNYDLLLASIINLLDRLHLFARRTYTEKITGKRFKSTEGSQDLAETEEFNPGEV